MNLEVNGYSIYFILLVTILSSYVLTFLAKNIAKHVGAIDVPNERKVHSVPMPRCGGLAIFGGFIIGYMIYGDPTVQMLSILLGAFIMVLVGFIDDINPIRARTKFFFQILAAGIVVIYGSTYFHEITFLGWNLNLPVWASMILSILFIVSAANAINLIDGMDGLAAGISAINFGTIAIIAFIMNKIGGLDIILSLIMLGSTLGFLGHNFPPAKIFMGDSGSLFLGFMIAVISLLGFKMTTITSLVVPLLILAIPIFDTLFAILRRLLKGESIGKPDKEHFHHQLLKMKFGTRKTVIVIYFINILFSMVSIFYVIGDNQQAIILYVCLMIMLLFLVLKTDILFAHHNEERERVRMNKEVIDKTLIPLFDKTYIKKGEHFYNKLKSALKNKKKMFVVTANPEAFMLAQKDERYFEMLQDSETVIVPDGIGLVKAGHILGYDIAERIPGVDIAEVLLKYSNELKLKVYLFGSKKEVIDKMSEMIHDKYPKVKLVGAQDGYIEDKDSVFEHMEKMSPDVVLVALGMPLQEELIYKHLNKFKKGIFVGVGGSFDVLSGMKKRAPKIFIKLNLEWLYRIMKEPKRLKRFWDNNVKFIFKVKKVKKANKDK